jgi:2-methylcitrate dehydratase PrpD
MDDVAEKLSGYVSAVRFEDLSPQAVESAKKSSLDTIVAMLAGSSASGIDVIAGLAVGWGGNEEAHLVGFGERVPAPAAAWCNASMGRALEIDDCLDFLPVHPSASTVPALLALAELKGGISGKIFLAALAVGQDVITRMGLAVSRNFIQSGRMNLFRIFGPTAALARALEFSSEQTRRAMGIAFSYAVGDGQTYLDGGLTVRLQQGIVAQGALISILLAEKGFTGANDFLMGDFGYFRAFEPDPHLEFLTEELGERFYGDRVSIKPFSACRATHQAIELALLFLEETGAAPDSILRIICRTSPEIHGLVGSPEEKKRKPDSVPAAQFSLYYAVAAALIRGDFFLDELEATAILDPSILRLAKRVKVEPDPSLRTDSAVGRTVMTVEREGAPPWTRGLDDPLGSPSRPITYRACTEKLKKCVPYALNRSDPSRMEELADLVAHMEDLSDVSVLIPYLI